MGKHLGKQIYQWKDELEDQYIERLIDMQIYRLNYKIDEYTN